MDRRDQVGSPFVRKPNSCLAIIWIKTSTEASFNVWSAKLRFINRKIYLLWAQVTDYVSVCVCNCPAVQRLQNTRLFQKNPEIISPGPNGLKGLTHWKVDLC